MGQERYVADVGFLYAKQVLKIRAEFDTPIGLDGPALEEICAKMGTNHVKRVTTGQVHPWKARGLDRKGCVAKGARSAEGKLSQLRKLRALQGLDHRCQSRL